MFSFLDDKELYGTSLDGQPGRPAPTHGGSHVSHMGGGGASPPPPEMTRSGATDGRRDAQGGQPPVQQPPPRVSQFQDVVFKSLALMEQRMVSLEERVVLALEKLSFEEARERSVSRAPHPSSQGFWSLALTAAFCTVVALLAVRLIWPRNPSEAASSMQTATAMPYVIQGLGASAQQPLLHMHQVASSPPTPVLFSAPTSFLTRAL